MRRAVVLSASLVIAALVGACTHRGSDGSQREAPSLSCTGSPVVNGSRYACLEPPYTPPRGAKTLADATPFVRENDGRRFVFDLGGDTELSLAHEGEPNEIYGLLERLHARKGALSSLDYGIFCGDRSRLCLQHRLDLCEAPVQDVAAEIIAAIAEDPILPRPATELSIELSGLLGPRCELDQASCAPEPFTTEARYDPFGKRGPRFHLGSRGGPCDHDGECMLSGCGNRCEHWTCPGAYEASTCEGYSFSKPTFCGCVRGECGFFSQ